MNVERGEGIVSVTLSRRNLTQILEALDRGFTTGIRRRCEDGTALYVRAEEDAVHYGERQPGPGLDRILPPKGDA